LTHRHAILVIEDDADTREGLILLVKCRGVDAVGAENGRRALATLRAGFRPCLVLLGLIMPDVDGIRFREAQLADDRLASIPVLVCTGAAPAVIAEAGKLGLTRVTGKRPDWREIVGVIREHCTS
jgi:CheY-like chemotaxis protein